MHREPDVGLDPRSPGSHPGPKASAKPLCHPGIPLSCAVLQSISPMRDNHSDFCRLILPVFELHINRIIQQGTLLCPDSFALHNVWRLIHVVACIMFVPFFFFAAEKNSIL